MPGGEKLTIPAFAAKVKEKYPEYKDVDDTTLTQKIVEKYPEYKDKVDYEIKVAKPLPTQQQQTGFGIDPVGTYKPEPVRHDLPKTNGDISALPQVLNDKHPSVQKDKLYKQYPNINASAVDDFSFANSEPKQDVLNKIQSGDYVVDEGKVKVKGGFIDNLGQGAKDFMNNLGLALAVEGAKANKNTDAEAENEIKYHLNEFKKQKRYEREVAATDVPGQAGRMTGGLVPYVAAGAVTGGYGDIPLMGLSNMGESHQEIWNDPHLTEDEKVKAINRMSKDDFMIGAMQGAAFHGAGAAKSAEKATANELLSKYAPTANSKVLAAKSMYNNLNSLLRDIPEGTAKTAGIFSVTQAANELNKGKEGVAVDFTKVPQAAITGTLFHLIMAAPKVLTTALSTIGKAVETGEDKANPEWFNSYNKQTQDALNDVVKAPQPMYEQMMANMDATDSPAVDAAKTKIETFRKYYNDLPTELPEDQKDKALHIIQLKTEAVGQGDNEKASAYDGLLQKVISGVDVNEKKEPLLIDRFSKPESADAVKSDINEFPEIIVPENKDISSPQTQQNEEASNANAEAKGQEEVIPTENGITQPTTAVGEPLPTAEIKPEGQVDQGAVQPSVDGNRPDGTDAGTPVLKDISNEVTAESNTADQPSEQPTTKEVGANEVSTENKKAAGGGEKPPTVEIAVGDKGQEMVGVTHHAMDKLAEEFGLPDRYDKKDSSVPEWDAKATERIQNGEMPALVKKLEAGGDINEVEQRMILQHVAGLKHEYEVSKDEKVLDEFRRIKKLNDIVGNTWGKVGVARQGQIPPHPLEGGLVSAIVAKEEANGVDKLTEAQRKEVESQVEVYKKAAADAEAKVAAAEAKNSELLAEKELAAAKKSSPRATKKTKEAFVTERKAILDSIKDKWKNASNDGTLTVVPVPYAKQLYAIAPDVAKLVRSLVEEGIDTLADVVSNVHATMKEAIPEIKESDVRDIIAGKYREQKETKSELQTKIHDIKREQEILNEFERVNNDEPKTEKATIAKNRKLAELNKKLDQLKKEKGADQYSSVSQIKRTIASNERAAAKLKERVANKDFQTEKPIPFSENMELKKKHPELYNDALNAMFKKEEARHAFDIAQRKDELANRTKSEKIIDFAKKLAGTTRAVAAGIDDSFALVQAGWTLMTNPKEGAYAFKEHVKDAFSEERFNREMTKLHNSPVWSMVKNSGLDILSPQSLMGKEREELFVNTFLDNDFKVGGKSFNVGKYTTKPFERAFTSLGNNLRLGLFNKQVQVLYERGKTFESHPQEFKDAARVINELTGRGKLHPKIEQVSDIITPFIWSPRMIASSMNLLGVSDIASMFIAKKGFYGKLSPSARNMALSQMAKGIGLAASLMAAAAYGGAQVDYDPESVTFGDIKFGNKSYNVFGRYASMIKLVVQVVSGKRKSITGGEEDLDKRGGHSRIGMVGSFLRGKMTPLSGTAFDAIQHEDYYKHTPVTPVDAAMNVTIPMSMKNLKKGLQQDGTLYLLNDFLPSFFGMTVKDARDFPMGATTGKYGGGGAVGDFLDKNDLTVPMARQNTIKVTPSKRPMTDDEFAKFKVAREKAVTDELKALMDKGKWVNGVKITLKDEKLTVKEKQDLISKAASRATEKAKEEVFGKQEKTMEQKMIDREDYINNKLLKQE